MAWNFKSTPDLDPIVVTCRALMHAKEIGTAQFNVRSITGHRLESRCTRCKTVIIQALGWDGKVVKNTTHYTHDPKFKAAWARIEGMTMADAKLWLLDRQKSAAKKGGDKNGSPAASLRTRKAVNK